MSNYGKNQSIGIVKFKKQACLQRITLEKSLQKYHKMQKHIPPCYMLYTQMSLPDWSILVDLRHHVVTTRNGAIVTDLGHVVLRKVVALSKCRASSALIEYVTV